MDPKMREKTDRIIRSANLQGANTETLIEIIRLQADRINELEDHTEWIFGKLEKLNKIAGLSTE